MKRLLTLITMSMSILYYGLNAQNCAEIEWTSETVDNMDGTFTHTISITVSSEGGSTKNAKVYPKCNNDIWDEPITFPACISTSATPYEYILENTTCPGPIGLDWVGYTGGNCDLGTDCACSPIIPVGGTTSGPAAVCEGSNATLSLSDSEGLIQWQKRLLPSGTFEDIDGGTSSTLVDEPGASDLSYEYRACLRIECNPDPEYSSISTVQVDATSVGGIVTGDNCGGSFTLPSSTGVMTLGGNTGSILKWQRRINGVSWVDIANTTPTLTESFTNDPDNSGVFEYRAEVKNGTCPAVFSAICTIDFVYQAPQPVELISFSCEQIDRTVQLKWRTASEADNEGFVLLRSSDGSGWNNLGFVPGQGTTTQSHSYAFIDEEPLPSVNYYKLAQRDFNGKIEYSKVVSLDMTLTDLPLMLYPNPATDQVTVIRPEMGNANLHVYDMFGRLCLSTALSDTEHDLSLSELPSGVFQIVIEEDGVFSSDLLFVE